MELERGVHVKTLGDLASVRSLARFQEVPIYELDTGDEGGREVFFDAVTSRVPMNPPLLGKTNLDAFSDSLWNGLHSLESEKLIIIWSNGTKFRGISPEEFDIAFDTLLDVSNSLSDPVLTIGFRKDVCVYIS